MGTNDNEKLLMDIELLPAPAWMQDIATKILGVGRECRIIDIAKVEEAVEEHLDQEMYTVLAGQEVRLLDLMESLTTYAGSFVIFPAELQEKGPELIESLLVHEQIHEEMMVDFPTETIESVLEEMASYGKTLLEGLFPGHADEVSKEIAEIIYSQIIECIVNRALVHQDSSKGWALLAFLLSEFPSEDPFYYAVYGIDLIEFLLFLASVRAIGVVDIPTEIQSLIAQQETHLPDFVQPFFNNVTDALSDVVFNDNFTARDLGYTGRSLTRVITALENNVNYGMYYTSLEVESGTSTEDILGQIGNALEDPPDLPTTNMVRRFIGEELYAHVTQEYAIPWLDENGIVNVEIFFNTYEEEK